MNPKERVVAVVAGGEVDPPSTAAALSSHATIVAVDGGLIVCDALKITPSLITGDFDTTPPELLQKYGTIPQLHNPDQDKPDLEKALEYLFTFPLEKVIVYGALGKRMDHTLTNICLLSRYPGRVIFETAEETLFVIDGTCRLAVHPGQTLSLIPLNGAATGITTTGLRWELKEKRLDKHFVGISNVCLSEEVTIACANGDLLCCVNKQGRDATTKIGNDSRL